jgi:hypothetical protein
MQDKAVALFELNQYRMTSSMIRQEGLPVTRPKVFSSSLYLIGGGGENRRLAKRD